MKYTQYLIPFVVTLFLIACGDEVKDEQKPVIDMTVEGAFPQNCATVYRGEPFVFKAKLTDNMELGSYSIEMHHNFDHHTHSTSGITCDMEPIKKAVTPFLFLSEYSIPLGLTSFTATVQMDIPATVDTGDYHFMLRVTDKAGWQTFEGISVKIADRL
jgi:Domain of unknown function (DUF4625)